MSTKHLRDLAAYATGLGLADVRVEQRGRHPHLVGVRPSGSEVRLVVPLSPSDGAHGEHNTKAQLRRLVQPPVPAGHKVVGVRIRKRPRRPRPTGLDAVALRAEFANLMENER